MQFVNFRQQRGRGDVADNRVGGAESDLIRDPPLTMAGFDVGMRLIRNEGVGIGGPDAPEKVEITGDTGTAEADREIILHLSGHQDAPTAYGEFERGGRFSEIVFGDATRDELRDQTAAAFDQCGVEFGLGEKKFEITAHTRIEMHAALIENE